MGGVNPALRRGAGVVRAKDDAAAGAMPGALPPLFRPPDGVRKSVGPGRGALPHGPAQRISGKIKGGSSSPAGAVRGGTGVHEATAPALGVRTRTVHQATDNASISASNAINGMLRSFRFTLSPSRSDGDAPARPPGGRVPRPPRSGASPSIKGLAASLNSKDRNPRQGIRVRGLWGRGLAAFAVIRARRRRAGRHRGKAR